ncbi:hypothetical protein JCM9534A_07680 [Catenuloplanes indicus JCM 9534]|uniref:Uncharacterized protein n=1 Tax=Catenuloplanes indicus TaxID=137267 RepID=A0AAE4AVX4_9ACTN|nr:hypothetical protein [Catenuloplanes indicus]
MTVMNVDERCVVDPGRPCGACSAPGPDLCPYRYLLDDDELPLPGERPVVATVRRTADGGLGACSRNTSATRR